MPVTQEAGKFLAPKTVTIFMQPPDPAAGFVPLILTQVSIPSPNQVAFDLAETEELERRWTVVRNPVERFTAQNRIREPDQLMLTGMLSANPLNAPLLSNVGAARLDKRELLKLKTFLETSLSFIVTPERAYKDMACVSFRERYDDTTGQGVNLALRFQELRIAGAGLVESQLDLENLTLGSAGTTQLGPQTGSAVPDPGGLG